MRHVEIKSSADLTEVDIFGQIGDSFFEEGNTLESVRAEISNTKHELIINVASLGGVAFEGLAIHDLIASHPYNTTVNILGATASAAAVIAMAGDTVNISENSLFLVHDSHGIAQGNADELESIASDMRKVDDRMVSIFTKRTGKTESEVRELMKGDKFISPVEAKEFGFVDSIKEPAKIAASIDKEKIKNSLLTENQKFQILNSSKMELTPITNQLKELTEKVTNFISANKEVKIADEKEITEEITGIVATLETLGNENKTLGTENQELNTKVSTQTEEIKTLNAELSKYKATPVEVEPKVDTEPTEELNTNEGAFGNTFKQRIYSRLTN
jgi:ATP-dependent protease ClpP protease subunit